MRNKKKTYLITPSDQSVAWDIVRASVAGGRNLDRAFCRTVLELAQIQHHMQHEKVLNLKRDLPIVSEASLTVLAEGWEVTWVEDGAGEETGS